MIYIPHWWLLTQSQIYFNRISYLDFVTSTTLNFYHILKSVLQSFSLSDLCLYFKLYVMLMQILSKLRLLRKQRDRVRLSACHRFNKLINTEYKLLSLWRPLREKTCHHRLNVIVFLKFCQHLAKLCIVKLLFSSKIRFVKPVR